MDRPVEPDPDSGPAPDHLDDVLSGEIPGFVRLRSLPYRPAVFSLLIRGPGGLLACSIPLDGSLEERRKWRTP